MEFFKKNGRRFAARLFRRLEYILKEYYKLNHFEALKHQKSRACRSIKALVVISFNCDKRFSKIEIKRRKSENKMKVCMLVCAATLSPETN